LESSENIVEIKKKKIIFIIQSLNFGGAEQIITTLANNLSRDKYEIKIALLAKEGELLKIVKNDITIVDLKTPRMRNSIIPIVKLIRKEKPHAVFSTIGSLNILMSLIKPFFPKVKFIGRETSVPSINLRRNRFIDKLLIKLYKQLNRLDLIIAQSNYMKIDLINNLGINKTNIVVINNPLNRKNIKNLAAENMDEMDNSKKHIVAVGRLNEVKGYDRLLKAFALLPDKQNTRLWFIGNGPEKQNLEKLSRDLKIKNSIIFKGYQENPYKYIANSNILAITSIGEGFPNAVLEANACGKFVVGFKCPGGISEIIQDQVNGKLVENGDINQLSKEIEKAINSSFNKTDIKTTTNKYNLEDIILKYEIELDILLNQKKNRV
jgi:glycosyltransferase involved in cell wall biosynthesis